MKLPDRIMNLLGLGTERSAPPPDYLSLTDGLTITTQRATAWYVIGTSNTDQRDFQDVDDELLQVINTVTPVLEDYPHQYKIIWGDIDGDQYLESLGDVPTPLDVEYANYLDTVEIAQRWVLVGVDIDTNRAAKQSVFHRRGFTAALGLPGGTVTKAEETYYHGTARTLGRRLTSESPWMVQLADVETIMWMISRETHRATLLARTGTVTGSTLIPLTSGRVIPYTDHLKVIDGQGKAVRHVAVLSLADFPDELETGGQQEWLRRLSQISRVDHQGELIPVRAEAHIRARVMGYNEASKRLTNAEDLAKEQAKSASQSSIGRTEEEMTEAEGKLRDLKKELSRRGKTFIELHPLITVSEESYADLKASVAAVIAFYRLMGITAYVGEDEQRDMWLETQPGDQVRVADLYQVMDGEGFFGSWFWGGSAAGDQAPAPAIAYLTGSTPGLIRHSFKSGARAGDTTTTMVLGRSGRGKTTTLMLGEAAAVADGKTWACHLSLKGDDLALVDFIRARGATSELIPFDARHSGCADVFRSMELSKARERVKAQLVLLAPTSLVDVAETIGSILVDEEANASTEPNARPATTWGVIQRLLTHEDERARRLGAVLEGHAQSDLGAPVLGPWTGQEALVSEPGMWMLQLPDLIMPSATARKRVDWEPLEKLSVAVVRAVTWHCLAVARNAQLREMDKLLVIPEVHRIANSEDGADFLDQTARMGRAQGVNLVFDTQDATSISEMQGVLEQVATVYVFQFVSRAQQDAAGEILGFERGSRARSEIGGLAPPDADGNPTKGRFIMRDRRGEIATGQVFYPSEDARVQLNTNPDADRLRAEYAERIAEEATANADQYRSWSDDPNELDPPDADPAAA